MSVDDLKSALAGRYEVVREIGSGAMATVYLARDLRHERHVALKVLRQDLAQSLGAERFLREIHLAAKLSHPHILPLFDSGDANGALYYVMPNVEGVSLRDRLEQQVRLPIDEAVRVVTEVADALDYAHRHGVVHRDVKPENIMLHEGHALVADFGIGKALSEIDADAFTQAGVSVGTPAYMSPEQASGDAVDGRTDIYSLGCVFYELLTGEQPFVGVTAQAVIAKRFVQTPTDVSALREGVPRTVATTIARALARAPTDRFDTGAQLIAALARHSAASRIDAPEKSIAVLPFANMSADPENEFFADGITEEILNALSQIAELRVAGRTSAFSFKGRNVDLAVIGEQLRVRTVLEGSVRRAGNRVRITAQLIDVQNGYHLWSERYDREVDDVFAVQDEIAGAIAKRMQASVTHDRGAVVEQRSTERIDAYQAYLKARALLRRRGADLKEGMALMERAVVLDPNYGVAWAGVADAYGVLGVYGGLKPELVDNARRAAARALELAPDLPEAHVASATVALLFDWDFDAAGRSFERAIAINPGYDGLAWHFRFYWGSVCGRWREALEGMSSLQQRDPQSAYFAGMLSTSHSEGGDGDEALRWANRAMELDPNAFLSGLALGAARYKRREFPEAIAVIDALLARSGRHPLVLPTLAVIFVELGQLDDARSVYQELLSRARREHITPSALATVAAALGETSAALEYAREAVRLHDPQFPTLLPSWKQARWLRALPEFQEMLRQARLPVVPGQS